MASAYAGMQAPEVNVMEAARLVDMASGGKLTSDCQQIGGGLRRITDRRAPLRHLVPVEVSWPLRGRSV
jgi:hypothetical protein